MKMTHYLLIVVMAGALAVAGCGKSSQKAPPHQPGVVNLADLRQAFPDPTPEIRASLDKLRFSTRYGQHEAALVELDKLANVPNLTDPQKKAVNDVIEQVKEAIKLRPAAPPQ